MRHLVWECTKGFAKPLAGLADICLWSDLEIRVVRGGAPSGAASPFVC